MGLTRRRRRGKRIWERPSSDAQTLIRDLGRALWVATTVAVSVGCSRTPDELPATEQTARPSPEVAPLAWTRPPTWTEHPSPSTGPRKATYKVAPVGDDKAEAEVWVMFFGTGHQGDVETNVGEWYKQFDGEPKTVEKRETFKAGALDVTWVEWPGTYKVPMGPAGPGGKAPMQMIKKDYRLIGAVVQTPDRGNWFFRMVGPDDTVEAARSAFRSMVETAK